MFDPSARQRGYEAFRAPHIADLLATDHLVFTSPDIGNHLPSNNVSEVEQALSMMHKLIGDEFLSHRTYHYTLGTADIKGNYQPESHYWQWHTDCDEPCDVFFLLYFNNLTLYNEGAFSTKVGDTIYRHVPQYGDLLMVYNNECNILHRGEFTQHRRVIASFDYNVKWKLGYET